jgi:hypothetical protein
VNLLEYDNHLFLFLFTFLQFQKNPTICYYDFFYVNATAESLQQITQVKENLLLTLPPHCCLNVVTNVDEDGA